MEPKVFTLVLATAVTHAAWNAWLKLSGDRLIALATIGVGWAVFAVCALPLVGLPAGAAWPYLAASVVAHTLYPLTLIAAYRQGELSMIYPIARGAAPLLVTAVSAWALGETLDGWELAAVLLVATGIVGLGAGRPLTDRGALQLSLVAGALIALYTLLDGVGARAGGSANAYVVWLFLLSAAPLPAIAWAVHGRRSLTLARPLWVKGFAAGLISAGAYWIVLWAMTVAPLGLVSAVRESSIAFAALLGAGVLRERVRWGALALVLGGIALIRLAAP